VHHRGQQPDVDVAHGGAIGDHLAHQGTRLGAVAGQQQPVERVDVGGPVGAAAVRGRGHVHLACLEELLQVTGSHPQAAARLERREVAAAHPAVGGHVVDLEPVGRLLQREQRVPAVVVVVGALCHVALVFLSAAGRGGGSHPAGAGRTPRGRVAP